MNPSPPDHDPAAEEQAALWATRLERESFTADDEAALDVWLAENPAHSELLSRYCQFSASLDQQLPALAATGAMAMPPRQAGPIRESASRRTWSPGWMGATALAAAALVMLAVWLVRPGRQSGSFVTAAAQRQSLTLADGTRVELNARTTLQVEINGVGRQVRLKAGEAFFTVSKDPARPFIVETPAGSVRVTGTVFSVHSETMNELEVTVVEGSVQVRPGEMGGARAPEPLALRAGDHLSARPQGVSRRTLFTGELADALAWREGYIVFDGVPLSEALTRFGYYHSRELTASPEAGGRKVSGRYSLDDLDGFLAQIQRPLETKVTAGPNGARRVSLRTEP